MTIMGCCVPSRDTSDRFYDRCFNVFPCLSDPVRRSTLCLRLALVILHLIYVGFLFVFDVEFVAKAKQQPCDICKLLGVAVRCSCRFEEQLAVAFCFIIAFGNNLQLYTVIYLLLVAATIVQYFFTSGSSPGYVLDAMRDYARTEAAFQASEISKQPASSKNGSVVVTLDRNQLGENLLGNNPMNWTKLVMEMYPDNTSVRTYTCIYCNVVQPPRTKHCHDCDRCVLQFDHHCVWLGTCIGQGNHCRFWWYILEETALSIWTGILYIKYLQAHIEKAWLMDVIVIILLSILSIALIFLLLLLLFHRDRQTLSEFRSGTSDPIRGADLQHKQALMVALTLSVLVKRLRISSRQEQQPGAEPENFA
ncbi:protein S-acyltransferase 10 [Tanacetum coccineum]